MLEKLIGLVKIRFACDSVGVGYEKARLYCCIYSLAGRGKEHLLFGEFGINQKLKELMELQKVSEEVLKRILAEPAYRISCLKEYRERILPTAENMSLKRAIKSFKEGAMDYFTRKELNQ